VLDGVSGALLARLRNFTVIGNVRSGAHTIGWSYHRGLGSWYESGT
jgi:hypothetical protein